MTTKQRPEGRLTYVETQLKTSEQTGTHFIRLVYKDEKGELWAHETASSVFTIEPLKVDIPYTKAPMAKEQEFLLDAAKAAYADLQGIMPEFEPSGDREHSGWKSLKELKKAIADIDPVYFSSDKGKGAIFEEDDENSIFEFNQTVLDELNESFKEISRADKRLLFNIVRQRNKGYIKKAAQLVGYIDFVAYTFESCSLVFALYDHRTIIEICHTPESIVAYDAPDNPLFQREKI